MKWKTAISNTNGDEHHIRGIALSKLIANHSFTEVVFLLLTKRLPTEQEATLLDMLLVSSAEHGIAAPSVFSARTSASVGNQLNASLAAGLLATGQWHGGAVEECARLLESPGSAQELVAHAKEHHTRVSGFGHKIYKDKDPRAEALLAAAHTLLTSHTHITKARAVERELKTQLHKELPLNIDGAHAAILLDMGFPSRTTNGVFLLGRMPGMIAHITEEIENEKPYRRLSDDDIEFTG